MDDLELQSQEPSVPHLSFKEERRILIPIKQEDKPLFSPLSKTVLTLMTLAGIGFGGWYVYQGRFKPKTEPVVQLPVGIEPPYAPPEMLKEIQENKIPIVQPEIIIKEKPAEIPQQKIQLLPNNSEENQQKQRELFVLQLELTNQQKVLVDLKSQKDQLNKDVEDQQRKVDITTSNTNNSYNHWENMKPYVLNRERNKGSSYRTAKEQAYQDYQSNLIVSNKETENLKPLKIQLKSLNEKIKTIEYDIRQIEIKIKYKNKAIEQLQVK